MILLTGANGQLGTAVKRVFLAAGQNLLSFDRDSLDITDKKAISLVFKEYRPEIVINCAAYNQVEQAEENIKEAYANNAFGPYWLARAAADFDAKMIHVSTDYVFAGGKIGFVETDSPRPLNVYGASKLAGEQLVQIANQNSFIIRTSWLFGKNKDGNEKNFVQTMLAKAKEEKQIRVVSDQIGSPTYAGDLAQKIYELLMSDAKPGVYHITNQGHCSWYELAKKIFELAQIEVTVLPIKTEQSGSKIIRPNNSVLENRKLSEINLPLLRAWQEGLEDYIKEVI